MTTAKKCTAALSKTAWGRCEAGRAREGVGLESRGGLQLQAPGGRAVRAADRVPCVVRRPRLQRHVHLAARRQQLRRAREEAGQQRLVARRVDVLGARAAHVGGHGAPSAGSSGHTVCARAWSLMPRPTCGKLKTMRSNASSSSRSPPRFFSACSAGASGFGPASPVSSPIRTHPHSRRERAP